MAFISNLYLAFERVAKDNEDRVALRYPATGAQISYRKLSDLVDHIAKILWTSGLRQGQVAAFFHDKSPAAFAAMLACLRLGIIYTNLDPASPWERLRKILGNCKPSVIINGFATRPFAEELVEAGYQTALDLCILPSLHDHAELPPVISVTGSDPAYIMFTSGSTGTPKGAVMSHANLLWFVQWAQIRFGITNQDVLTNVNPIYFDNSVFDFYSAIFSGATLAPFTTDQVKDTRLLVQLVEGARCTVWFSVPSMLVYLLTTRALTSDKLTSIRTFIFGGEGFPKSKLKQLYDLYGARATLENVYGPTECTCICSAKAITADDFSDMKSLAPLGLLAQNFSYEIIPQSDTNTDFGELFLRGPQVGLGYFDDSERTRRAFTQNPRHNSYIDVGYLTGDLVQRDVTGWLHFKGRVDFQIKHMGYRIELEEIEAAISTLPGVTECAVVYQKLDDGLSQILGFVVGPVHMSSHELLRRVAAIVPAYMVPRRVELMDALPKNANGKIDRVALKLALEAPSQ
jgi:D-alanine--poly(phosphoribitol) ligase subunit 1